MDKVSVSEKDFSKILEWLNKHDKLRLTVDEIPLSAFKLVCDGYVAKFIKNGSTVELSLRFGDKPMLKAKAFLTPFDLTKRCLSMPMVATVEPSPLIAKNKSDEIKRLAQLVFNQYVAVMTFMAYGNDDAKVEYELSAQTTPQTSSRSYSKSKRKHNGITYVFQKRQSISKGGHHASPKGEFSVRGHYRHYKGGKVIWIAQFKKGSGKHKDKHYKFKRSDSVGN